MSEEGTTRPLTQGEGGIETAECREEGYTIKKAQSREGTSSGATTGVALFECQHM